MQNIKTVVTSVTKRFKSPAFGPFAIWIAQTYSESSIKGSQALALREETFLSTHGK